MPRLEPREWTCDTCGWTGVIHSSPVHCVCGVKATAEGKVLDTTPLWQRPGDVIEKLATPIAKALGKSGCGGCNKRRQAMNRAVAQLIKRSK